MKQNRKLTDLLALVVFAVFSLCVLAVLLAGASSYRALLSQGARLYEERTAVQYLATRVRQAPKVAVEYFSGCPALVIREEDYLTRIYCHEGFLRELYCSADADLSPEDGEAIVQAGSLSFALEERLLRVWIDDRALVLYLPEGEVTES